MAGQYTSGTITIPGLSGSGTDFNEMIDKLYEVEGLHAQQLIKWKNDWQLRKDAFTEIRTELVNLQSSLKKLNSVGKFLTKKQTSSNSSVATATLSNTSEARSYSLNVKKLAQAGMTSYKLDKDTITDPNAALGGSDEGTFTFTVGDKEMVVQTNAKTSLNGLAMLINGHPDNKTVNATVINTGDGYMLQLRNKETGLNTDISVDTKGVGGFSEGSWDALYEEKMVQNDKGEWVPKNPDDLPIVDRIKGQNAEFTLDGSNTPIYSTSNIVKDIVPGITFNLFSEGQATISVSLDTKSITENVESFVEAMNKTRKLLNDLTAVNTNKSLTDPSYSDSQLENQYGSILTGNYGVQLIISKLKTATASSGIGFDSVTNTFNALSQIGIMTNANEGSDNYGMLEINTTHSDDSPYGAKSFEEALLEDPEAVARLFATTIDAHTWGDTPIGYNGHVQGITKPGTYEVRYTVDSNNNVTGTIDGRPAVFEDGQLTSLEGPSGGVSVTIYDYTQNKEHTAQVSLRQGKINEILDLLQGDGTENNSGFLDKKWGSLSILEDNYTKIMGNINDKIIKENERLLVWERRMRLKFSRLEATLARYNQINDSLKSQIDSLSGGSNK